MSIAFLTKIRRSPDGSIWILIPSSHVPCFLLARATDTQSFLSPLSIVPVFYLCIGYDMCTLQPMRNISVVTLSRLCTFCDSPYFKTHWHGGVKGGDEYVGGSLPKYLREGAST